MKDNLKNKRNNMFSCFCILLLILCCISVFLVFKGTRAGFGGLTGCLAPTIEVTYLPNYPDDFDEPNIITDLTCNQFILVDNMYVVPSGYEFIGWNTLEDGSGDRYNAGSILYLEDNLNLYAQWGLINDTEIENTPEDNIHGDLGNNEDDKNTSDDNTSSFPSDNEDSENGDNSLNNGTGEDDGSNSSGNNSDDNNTNDQNNDNKGESSNDKESSNKNNSNKDNNNLNSNNKEESSNKDNNKENNNNDDNISKKEFYNFKFIVDDKEYASSTCEVLTDKTCLLLLPGINPYKYNFYFIGWSLNNECLDTEIITNSISVKSSNTYYACFNKKNDNKRVNFKIVAIVIFSIWVVAFTLLCSLIKWFKKKGRD